MKFHWWKTIVRGVWLDERWFYTSKKWSYGKLRHPWRENWQAAFCQDVGKICGRRFGWQVYCRARKQIQKTQRDVKLLQTFLETKNEVRKVEEIPAVELNEYMWEFIISVWT